MKEEKICNNNLCDNKFFVYGKKTFSPRFKINKFNYCPKCRSDLINVEIQCNGCGKVFTPTNHIQIYCSVDCKERYKAKKHYASLRYRKSFEKKCAFCNIIMPFEDGKYRKKICDRCHYNFIKRFKDLKCLLCGMKITGLDERGKMYCSKKCRAYSSLLLRRYKNKEKNRDDML